MPELKIHLPDELNQRFRKAAMMVYGYGRGSISRAAIEALSKWCTDHEHTVSPPQETASKEERTTTEPTKDEKTREHEKRNQDEASPPLLPDPSTTDSSPATT